jgi:peptide/nickel transport system substrate-binding protein
LELECELCAGVLGKQSGGAWFLRALGLKSLFGWPTMPKMEALRSGWIAATDPVEQKRLCREIQLQAFRDVPYIPLGAFFFCVGISQ